MSAQLDLFGAELVVEVVQPPRNVTLCQGVAELLAITSYTYDLGDEAFREYCRHRGVLYVAGRAGGRMWAYFMNYGLSLDDWLNDEGVRYAQECEGERHRYSDEAMVAHWRTVEIGRGKLEDVWRIWKACN